MPRARVPSARIAAGADSLILPWLAPRAFAASPAARPRRDGEGGAVQRCSHGPTVRNPAPRYDPSRANTAPTRPSLDRRYADIASFARRHARTYATAPEGWVDPFTQAQPLAADPLADPVASSTRYARRRSWNQQLANETAGLDPQAIGRRRVRLIAQAEERMQAQARRLQRDKRNYKNKLLYDGQYRSLARLVLSLKRWDHTSANVAKFTDSHAYDERWLLDAFAALDRNAYARLHALTKPITIEHDARCETYTRELLEGVERDGPERIWTNWHALQQKQKYYETTLVYMLDHKPGHAQHLMTALALDDNLPQARSIILADALAYLAKLHLKEQYHPDQGWDPSPATNVQRFITTFINCTQNMDAAVFSQDLLYSLVLLADPADLKRVYDALIAARARLSTGTTLHYASAFGGAGETANALQCLQRRLEQIRKTDRDKFVDTDVFRWTCATILRGSMRQANNYHETPGIVAKFVEFGVKMDLLLYDVIMHNAMDAGDFATAFKVFNALEGHGLKADKHTYSILLYGCTTQSNPAMFKAFAEFCLKKARELEDPWLATDYLYYIYICEHNKPAQSVDNALIWRTYLDLFDLTPLKPFTKFGSRAMRDSMDRVADAPPAPKLPPTEQALYLMLQTEIRAASSLTPAYLENIYTVFKRGVASAKAHPTVALLARNPRIWNAFLHAFCAKAQYASASALIKDMAAHATPPNIYSWNMLMQAFFKSSQVAAAERVAQLIRARGVQPDAYTHGVMVRGYAKAQLVDRVADSMRRLPDDAQMEPDLLRALARVQARADLAARLDENRKEREGALEAAARKKEEEERVGGPGIKSLFARAVAFRPARHWDHGSLEDAEGFLEPEEGDAGAAAGDRDSPLEDGGKSENRNENRNGNEGESEIGNGSGNENGNDNGAEKPARRAG